MRGLKIFNWGDSDKKISEASVRLKFPQPEFRVSRKLYKNEEPRPPGLAREGMLFVLNGACRCNFDGGDKSWIILNPGEGVEFPEGYYQIEPLGGQDAEVVFIWNLAEMLKEIRKIN